MAFKLSKEATQQILGERNYALAYNQELERLRNELENTTCSEKDTMLLRGELKMLRKVIALHDKALQQMEAEYTRKRASV